MKLDLSKLKHVVRKGDGKITAQCPACAADGGDAKGEHLVVFRDGKFGCVMHEKDKAHNRAILKLVGSDDRGDGGSGCRLTVTPMRVADSTVLMKVGRLGRVKPASGQHDGRSSPPGDEASPDPQGVTPRKPESSEDDSESWTDAEFIDNLEKGILSKGLREFLDLPVN